MCATKPPRRRLTRRSLCCAILVLFAWSLFTLAARAQSNNSAAYTFTTLAGQSGVGSLDGIGNNAKFDLPEGAACDSAGNIYVADTYNCTIRKVTPGGLVSTIAGLAGAYGTNDGTGSTARFNVPTGLAVDGAGNIYVADTGNQTIRKIFPGGVVITLAGTAGRGGTNDGLGTNTHFRTPLALALDGATNLYVADYANHTIRKITPGGVVSTFAGTVGVGGTNDGVGTNAEFYFPSATAVDRAGNVYVTADDTIRMITPGGVVSTIAGLPGNYGTSDGTGTNAQFDTPSGLIVDSSNIIYVADTGNNTVRMVAPSVSAGHTNWVVSTLAGNAAFFDANTPYETGSADGTGTNAQFSHPYGPTLDSAGNLYVADYGNNTIRKITSAAVVSTLAGLAVSYGTSDGTGGTARFFAPAGVAVDGAGNIYVSDSGNNTVRVVTSDGVVSTLAGMPGSNGWVDAVGSNARFDKPWGMAVNPAGNIYVSDFFNDLIRMVTSAGVVSTLTIYDSTTMEYRNATFSEPQGIAIGTNGIVYVAVDGPYVMDFAPAGAIGHVTGSAEAACVAVDASGNLYGAFNHSVFKVTPAGVQTTLASNFEFNQPQGIAVDGAGNVYIADTDDDIICEITPAGAVSILGGVQGSPGSADGNGSDARFNRPQGIVVDSAGNLYVSDTGNNTVRKGVFTAYTPANPTSFTPPPMTGRVTVTLLPAGIGAQWRFPWETVWRNSGVTASNLVQGEYSIVFGAVPGYLVLPLAGPVSVTNGGTTLVTQQYYPTISTVDTNNGGGTLTVNIGPSPPNGAGWRFLGNTNAFYPPDTSTNLASGAYLIQFAPVAGFTTPSSLSVEVEPGSPTVLEVTYLLAQSPPASVYLPAPVPLNEISDLTNYPFGFNGQLQTDVGYGSGVAVETNVVLTAAHLVFNDQTLSYVSQAYWFFQEEAGTFAPVPQAAQGWYMLSGYASQRTNDVLGGLGPDQSSPQSRNFDVAALYFPSPVANGGYGGFLPSDATPNTWLTSTAEKMLVGYPVDGTQFGFTNIVNGQMYVIGPQPYPLSQATDPVSDQQVYTISQFLSYPGNSGGPFYVQYEGYFYPAGVYLGTLFNGVTPYATTVRAIDNNVVNLITLAARLGDSGTNNSGGGVITVVPGAGIASNPGLVEVTIVPPAVLTNGGAWKFSTLPNTDYSTQNPSALAVTSTNALQLQFKAIAGWNLPSNQSFSVGPGSVVNVTNAYTVAVTWPTPEGISYGTPLGSNQLNATAITPGTFNYSPSNGAVLNPGTNTLAVTFTPTDAKDYGGASVTNVSLVVFPAPPHVGTARHSGNSFSFTWSATTNQTYQIQYTTNLALNIWSNLGSAIVATNTNATASDTISNLQKFYRVMAVP